ncbi:MAG: SpoIIE family protein phosphatase [Ignavibacteriaceae bacterium]
MQQVPLGLKLHFVGAVEIYIDGRLVHKYGKIGKNVDEEKAVFVFEYPEVSVFDFLPAPLDSKGYSTHLIAIRTSTFIIHDGILKGLSPIFKFEIGSIEEFRTEAHDISRLASIHLGVLTLLAFLRFTYFLVYKQLPKIFFLFSFLGAALYIWFLIKPIAAWDYVTILFMIIIFEMLRVIITSRIRKTVLIYEHSWIILFGLLPFAISSIYKALVVLVDIPELWNFISFPYTYYSLLAVLFSMSVFLARNFAKTNKDLEYRLEQVKSLSEKTLHQELEKAKLESENKRKTKELEEARQLQLSMLPKSIPVSSKYEIAVYMQTATEVGGDYYDFVVHNNDSLTIAVGDATGHGMQAGTMVAASKSLFKSKADIEDPATILKESSNALKEMGFSLMLMAMTVAKLKDNKISLSSAGMPFTLIFRNDSKSVEEIILEGMPLGSLIDFPYQLKEIQLSKGDTILFMSDGFPELFNSNSEILGYEKVAEIFNDVANEPAAIVIQKLLDSAKDWAKGHPQEDDITFLVIKVT